MRRLQNRTGHGIIFGIRLTVMMSKAITIPKIRGPYYNPRLTKDKTIRFGTQYPLEMEINDSRNGEIWKILGLIDGKRTTLEIIGELEGEIKDANELTLNLIENLSRQGIVYDANSKETTEGLTPAEIQRYARNTRYFSWIMPNDREFNYSPQVKLKHAKVTVLGVGGLGSSVAASLVATGVGNIHLLDYDKVESSNLNRQVLYSEEDVGKSKVVVAYEKLSKLNSSVHITYEERKISGVGDFVELLGSTDILVLGADKPEAIGIWCSDAALQVGTPWISGGYFGPKFICEGFIPHETGCLECYTIGLMNNQSEVVIDLRDENYNASIAPTSTISAQLVALDVIHYLIGFRTQFFGRRYIANALSVDLSLFQDIKKVPSCPKCGESGLFSKRRGRV